MFALYSLGHCVVCSSIYRFWLPLWYLQTLLVHFCFDHCIICHSICTFWLSLWYLKTFLRWPRIYSVCHSQNSGLLLAWVNTRLFLSTWRVPIVVQELLTLLKQFSTTFVCEICVSKSFDFCVVFSWVLFVFCHVQNNV